MNTIDSEVESILKMIQEMFHLLLILVSDKIKQNYLLFPQLAIHSLVLSINFYRYSKPIANLS